MEIILTYNSKTGKILLLDTDNKIVNNIVKDEYIDDTLLRLPLNIFSNLELYLGKDYKIYRDDLEKVINTIKSNLIIHLSNKLDI